MGGSAAASWGREKSIVTIKRAEVRGTLEKEVGETDPSYRK